MTGAEELCRVTSYLIEAVEDLVPRLARLPVAASEPELTKGIADLRVLADVPSAGLGFRVDKARARC